MFVVEIVGFIKAVSDNVEAESFFPQLHLVHSVLDPPPRGLGSVHYHGRIVKVGLYRLVLGDLGRGASPACDSGSGMREG